MVSADWPQFANVTIQECDFPIFRYIGRKLNRYRITLSLAVLTSLGDQKAFPAITNKTPDNWKQVFRAVGGRVCLFIVLIYVSLKPFAKASQKNGCMG